VKKGDVMSHRVAASALVIALSLVFASASSAETRGDHKDHQNHLTGKLTVPLTGSVDGGGSFAGTLTIQRFAVRHGAPVAIGAISGSLKTSSESQTVVHALLELPVKVGDATGFHLQRDTSDLDRPTIRFIQGTCGIVRVAIGGTDVDLLGLMTHLDPVMLQLNGTPVVYSATSCARY
jgi:hypothetical protein